MTAAVLRCESCGAPLEAAKCDYCGSVSILGATDVYARDTIRLYTRKAVANLYPHADLAEFWRELDARRGFTPGPNY
ncbi:MAG: hypothetical protein AB7Q29_16090 [Vicinamibacterales bacterium]